MVGAQRRFWIVILLTLLTAGGVSKLDRVAPIENRRFFTFPLTIANWSGTQIPMNPYVYQGIETPYLFLRNYQSPNGDNVNLAMVWFDDTNIAFHSPEACLGGIGELVKEKQKMRLKLCREITLVKDIVEIENTRQLVLYFFDVDGYVTTSQTAIRLRVLQRRLVFRRSSASFVRLMAPMMISEQQTMALLVDFLRDILPLIPDYTYTDRIQGH